MKKNKPKLSVSEKIDLFIENGVTDEIVRQLLLECHMAEIIRFDDIGNPYWESCGDPLDPAVELVFGDDE